MKLQSLLHFRTDIKDKLPQSNEIELGEIAINHATDGETLFIKNNDSEIAEFKDTKYYSKITDDIYSKLDTIDKTIEENELVTASGLNNLNDRVLALEDVTETNIANIEQLSVDFAELNKTVEDNAASVSESLTELNKTVEDNKAEVDGKIQELNKTVEDNKTEIDTKFQEVTQRIEKDELVTAAALTDLNERVTLVENGEIENPFFKSFATLGEYETAVASGEVVYPCVSFIEEDGTIKFMADVVYNAIVTLGEEYVTFVGSLLKSQFGFYPLCFSDYFDSVIVDGAEMIDSAETVTIDGVTVNAIRFPSEEIGVSYNVSFKVKEEPEILVSATDGEISSNVPFMTPFYGVLSYIEIDDSFHNRGLSTDSNKYYTMCSMYLSMNRDFSIKFVGDYFGAPVMGGSYLAMLLYGQLMLASDPNVNLNVTLSIPSGNTTYGTPGDVFDVDDSSTHTFYADYNYMLQNYNSYPNLNISIETY